VATKEEASAVDKAAMAVVTKADTEEDVAAAKGEVAVVPVPCEAIQDLDTDPHHIR
jgi:predicted dinucleotide-binding enzyme